MALTGLLGKSSSRPGDFQLGNPLTSAPAAPAFTVRTTQAELVALLQAGNIRATQGELVVLLQAGNVRTTQGELVVLLIPLVAAPQPAFQAVFVGT